MTHAPTSARMESALRGTLLALVGPERARAACGLFEGLPVGSAFIERNTTWTKHKDGWWDGVNLTIRTMKGGPDAGKQRRETSRWRAHSWAFGVELWLNPPEERDELWKAAEAAGAAQQGLFSPITG